jgi:hypothetical protein
MILKPIQLRERDDKTLLLVASEILKQHNNETF